MGFVSETFGPVTASFTEVDSDSESSGTGVDVDRGSTSEVENTELEGPSGRVPGPACDRAVDDSEPDEEEDHDGTDLGSFGESTDSNDTGNDLDFSCE